MSHGVPEYFCVVSECLSGILDVIGYSQEDRDRKVACATALEGFRCMQDCLLLRKKLQCHMFGSRGEGSTGPGLKSDQDYLYQEMCMNIVTDLSECQPQKNNLLMVQDDEFTHPGYVILQVENMQYKYNPTPDPVYLERMSKRVDVRGRMYLANFIFHRTYGTIGNRVFIGPAMHTRCDVKEMSIDTVITIKCAHWPNQAREWFLRRRLHGWPKTHHIQNAEKDGCFAAPVGHPESWENILEWRLSFSVTERKLTRSFEDTVMKVYILLKMIKKTYIEPHLDDAFSSYHCKVCMMWMRERTPAELWRTENLLYCLTICIKQLYDWAEAGYCPDYFIIKNNIYDRKIVGKAKTILIEILRGILTHGWQFLLRLECCNLGQILCYDLTNLDILGNISLKNIEIDMCWELAVDYKSLLEIAIPCKIRMLSHIPQEYKFLTYYIIRIMHAMHRAHQISLIYLHNILMTLLSQLGFYMLSVCKENAHSLSQKEVDYRVTLASRCLLLGINCDPLSVRLKLCGLRTMLGEYDLTEICLQHVSDRKTKIIFVAGCDEEKPFSDSESHLVAFYTHCFQERLSTEQILLNCVSFSVVYLPSETSITPTALRMEMFRSIGAPMVVSDQNKHNWYEWAVVDALICLYFFQYLNFSMLGKERHKQDAMDNMINVIKTKTKIPHRDTGLNILGYCFMREAQTKNAFICFCKSLKIRPYHNASKFYLAILFHKIHVNRGGRIGVHR